MTTAWLVDMGYVVKTAPTRFKLDYIAARDLLSTEFGRVQTTLFNGYDEGFGIPQGLRGFYQAMEQQGMTVRLHPMTGDAGLGDHRQRRVDVDLAAHMVWQASLAMVERVVLTSGDQDFLPAVEVVREKLQKEVVLFAYTANVHKVLQTAADRVLHFEDHEQRLARR